MALARLGDEERGKELYHQATVYRWERGGLAGYADGRLPLNEEARLLFGPTGLELRVKVNAEAGSEERVIRQRE